MSKFFLTQYKGSILGPIAVVLGLLMNAIFNFTDMIGVPNIGLSIILFTLVIYVLMTPLTIKQQKFSKMSAKMNPELQAIQAKYKNKKDNDSMMRMNEETKVIYEKYGTNPMGTCLPLLIQMPILFALYRVIYNMPAYVIKVKEAFYPLVTELVNKSGAVEFLQNDIKSATQFAKQFTNESYVLEDTVVDILNKCSSAEWAQIAEKFPDLSDSILQAQSQLDRFNNFLGLNIANSPSYTLSHAWSEKSFLLIIAALMIPFLAALTQWLNTKLMPQPDTGNDSQNAMATNMKTMNTMMPIMSAVFCFTLPAGMGLYWIAGAVIRSVQQVVINKHLDSIDIEELLKKNVEKANKKREKMGLPPQTVSNNARVNTRAMTAPQKPSMSQEEKEVAMKKATEFYNSNPNPGSITAKANMVRQYNEKNNKK